MAVPEEMDVGADPPVELPSNKVATADATPSSTYASTGNPLLTELESELGLQSESPGDNVEPSHSRKLEEGPDCQEVPPESPRTGVGADDGKREAEVDIQRLSAAFSISGNQPPMSGTSGDVDTPVATVAAASVETAYSLGTCKQNSADKKPENSFAETEQTSQPRSTDEIPQSEPERLNETGGVVDAPETAAPDEADASSIALATSNGQPSQASTYPVAAEQFTAEALQTSITAFSGDAVSDAQRSSAAAGKLDSPLGALATSQPATSEAVESDPIGSPQSTLAAAPNQASHELLETSHSHTSTSIPAGPPWSTNGAPTPDTVSSSSANDEHSERSASDAETASSGAAATPPSPEMSNSVDSATDIDSLNGSSSAPAIKTNRHSEDIALAAENRSATGSSGATTNNVHIEQSENATTQCANEAATTSSNALTGNIGTNRTSNGQSNDIVRAVEGIAFARPVRESTNSGPHGHSGNVASSAGNAHSPNFLTPPGSKEERCGQSDAFSLDYTAGIFVNLHDNPAAPKSPSPHEMVPSGFPMAEQFTRPPEETGLHAAIGTSFGEVEYECIVCRDVCTEYVFLPCGHGSCSSCFGRLRRLCHSCRQWIERVVPIGQLPDEDYSGWDLPLHRDREAVPDHVEHEPVPVAEQMAASPGGIFMEIHQFEGAELDELREAQGTQEDPRYPSMQTESARLNSLRRFWRGPGNPQELALAGLFADRPCDLELLCFHCGNGILIHSDTTDAWLTHLQLFPLCRSRRGSSRRNRRNTI